MDHSQKDMHMAEKIAALVAQQGGRVYYVGGFVRDRLAHRENKDIDIEVHGVTPAALEKILDSLGQRIAVGESFGIFNLRGFSLDIAMPRKEKLRGTGHKDFDVFVDPFIGTESAARRRDFTVNALMQDVLTGQVIDHFGGQADLEKGRLRHVCDESFAEDPLRVLRGAQFAARFGLVPVPETVALCSRMDLKALPRERILGELEKALLKAEKPSVFFETLRRMDQLGTWFPEVEALIGIPQNPKYHAEGDVWVHTMMVLDQAAKLRSRTENPLGFMLAALTHDFGKAICTEVVKGAVHAYAHETKGLPLVQTFLSRLTRERRLIGYVLNLVEHHMRPNTAAGAGSSIKSTNRMFDAALDPEALVCIATADNLGKIAPGLTISNEEFLYARLDIYRQYMARPFVAGQDLIDAGLVPDRSFSQILAHAHKLRLAGVEKDSALRQTLAFARKLSKKQS